MRWMPTVGMGEPAVGADLYIAAGLPAGFWESQNPVGKPAAI
jgi:hypothetical protein